MKPKKIIDLKRMAGIAMLEVLVAILVLSLAALANAGLQISGLRANLSSRLRSIVTAQSSDMADRMRANRPALLTYAATSGIPADPGCTTAASPCTAVDMATHDIYEWNTANANSLPGGVGIVCIDNTADPRVGTPLLPGCSGTGTTYSIKIWWDDSHGEKPLQLFVMNFQP